MQVWHDGQCQCDDTLIWEFRGGKLRSGPSGPYHLPAASDAWHGNPGYVEVSFESADGTPVFRDKAVFALYSLYQAPGRKSFMSDNSYKYGAPR